jgi:predicted dehydrogenase
MTRTAQLRAGIIGPGGIGRVHIDALRRIGVEVVAIAASSEQRSRDLAAELRVPVASASAEALVALDEVDVVHVCTPNVLHPGQVRLALAAGKHVVCEKPLAISPAVADALHREAEESGRVHAVAYNYRHYPAVQAMRAAVAAGELGRVHLVRGCQLLDELLTIDDPGSWLLDADQRGEALSLADVGVHWWDLVEHVTGRRIERVLCARQAVRSQDAIGEDSAAVMLALEGGATAIGAISGAAPGHANTIELELIGTEASAWWEQEDPDRLWLGHLGDPVGRIMRPRETPGVDVPGTLQMPAGHVSGYLDAFRDLLATVYRSIGGAAEATYPTFADGARGIRVLDALVRSAGSGAWTPIGV